MTKQYCFSFPPFLPLFFLKIILFASMISILISLHEAVKFTVHCAARRLIIRFCVTLPLFVAGWIVHQRISYIERNWPYFLGFGLPLAILTNLTSSLFIRWPLAMSLQFIMSVIFKFPCSACIFGVLFPLFLVSANYATPIQST